MTSYERYMGMLKGQKVDVLPRLPILMAYAAKFIGSNYGAFASDYRVLVEANLRCAEFFGFDQVSAISDPYRETQGFGAEIEYVRDGVPRCVKAPLRDSTDLAQLQQARPAPVRTNAGPRARHRGIQEGRLAQVFDPGLDRRSGRGNVHAAHAHELPCGPARRPGLLLPPDGPVRRSRQRLRLGAT